MWTNRDTKPTFVSTKNTLGQGWFLLGCHEQHAQNFTDASETTGINLNDIYRVGLQKLFKHHAVMRVLSSCNTDSVGFECFANSCVSQNIIRSRGLFDKPVGRVKKLLDELRYKRAYQGLISSSPLT